MVGKWLALWKYFKRAAEVKTSLYHRLLAVYIKQHFHAIQRVIDTINDGPLYLRGPVRIGTYTL